MSASSLGILVGAIKAAAVLTGVSVSYGGESLAGLDRVPPLIDIVPVGGSWTDNGYAQGVDPDVMIWMTTEQVDLYCYGFSTAAGATAVDHADSARNICNLALQAMQSQAALGLKFSTINGQWVTGGGEYSQFGRAYKLSINVDISMTDVLPVNAPTPITTTITPAVTHG